MRRATVFVLVLCVLALLLTACGARAEKPRDIPEAKKQAETGVPAEQPAEEPPAQEAQETPEESAAPGGAAYAWLGMEDMPRCPYLDAVATSHYCREFIYISTGNVYTETTVAVDGVNNFCGTEYTRSYSVDGRSLGINDAAMIYWEREDNSSGSEAARTLEQAMARGENLSGRAFAEAGRGAVPAGYAYFFDDVSEYDYYEYCYPATDEYGLHKIERYYMRNGDVFAIYYEESFSGEILSDYTEVNQSISTDIPDGIFDFPNLDGYTQDQ